MVNLGLKNKCELIMFYAQNIIFFYSSLVSNKIEILHLELNIFDVINTVRQSQSQSQSQKGEQKSYSRSMTL